MVPRCSKHRLLSHSQAVQHCFWRKEDEQTEESVSGPERTAADSHADLQVDVHIYMIVHTGSVPSVPYMSWKVKPKMFDWPLSMQTNGTWAKLKLHFKYIFPKVSIILGSSYHTHVSITQSLLFISKYNLGNITMQKGEFGIELNATITKRKCVCLRAKSSDWITLCHILLYQNSHHLTNKEILKQIVFLKKLVLHQNFTRWFMNNLI